MTSGGRLIILSGPAGAGKTTVAERLLEDPRYERVVTATTRPPRRGERDGVDYHFLAADEFERWVKEGRLLEHKRVHDHLYGSPRAAVEDALERGRNVLLVIDVEGARQVLADHPDLDPVTVFLLPPSELELLRRLRGRGSESEDEIATRLETARRELAARDLYRFHVINDDLERAVTEIRTIVEAGAPRAG